MATIKARMAKKMGGKGVGYQRSGYSWDKSMNFYNKNGYFRFRNNGEGHEAGEDWAKRKMIDPKDPNTRYGKNSPSFDEGVWTYKHKQKDLTLI